MKNNIKYLVWLLTLFLLAGQCFPQEINYSAKGDTSLKILGLIDNGSEKYFVTELGALPLGNEDPYRDYYRTIYNDSTLINPNTVIGNNQNINFLPVMDISGYEGSYRNLENEYYLSDFAEISSDGKLIFKPGYLWIFNKHYKRTGEGLE